jgi:hypothetical protein
MAEVEIEEALSAEVEARDDREDETIDYKEYELLIRSTTKVCETQKR